VIPVDTSIWIDHLRQGDPDLVRLLETGTVLLHPWVIGEIALGNLRNRDETLQLLCEMPQIAVASSDQVLSFVTDEVLHGLGIGYVDAQLLCSVAAVPKTFLWTRDRRLLAAAQRLELSYQ
jgi:predicted nucleic acid-binding protein